MIFDQTPSLRSALSQRSTFDCLRARCPHCGAAVIFLRTGSLDFSSNPHQAGTERVGRVETGKCPGCAGLVVGAITRIAELLWPMETWPDRAPAALEPEIKRTYDEARQIVSLSPIGGAVLARRCLQHVIRTKLQIKKRTLFDEIVEALKRPELSKPVRDALDHVRELGNWGAHPIEGRTEVAVDPANTIIEVSPEDAQYTLQVVELLFHDLYTLPSEIALMEASISARRTGSAS